MHTLSFTILDDLRPMDGPYHVELENLNQLEDKIKALISQFKYDEVDASGHFDSEFWANEDQRVKWMAQELRADGYYVRNWYNKYYVVAFALDYTRFLIRSKGCDPQLTKWRQDGEDDSKDPIKYNME